VRIAGAVYLIWLGWKLLRANAGFGEVGRTPKPRGGFFLQGFLVLMSNPKALLWFGAFIPQFVDPAGNYVGQIMLLGATAMATAALTDGAYAILGGRTGRFHVAETHSPCLAVERIVPDRRRCLARFYSRAIRADVPSAPFLWIDAAAFTGFCGTFSPQRLFVLELPAL